jgi:hypothetical protein
MEEARINTQAKIFVAFSSIDRYEVVESILYHLANYGIAIWYDRHRMRLGDLYCDNFSEGISNTDYAVVILSRNINSALCLKEEMECIKAQFDQGKLTVFPLLYKIKPDEIPIEYQWITKLVYKEFDDKSGTLLICNHIMSRILTDELQKCSHQSLYDLQKSMSQEGKDAFLETMLRSYLDIDRNNLNARIAILFCLYTYATIKYGIVDILPQHYWRVFERFFSYTKLHLEVDSREMLILELAIMILINKVCY